MIFVKAELVQLNHLSKLLEMYEKLAGQRVNYKKSEVISSGNIDKYMLNICGAFLGMKVVDGIPKILRLTIDS